MNTLEIASDLIRFDSTWYHSNLAVSDHCELLLQQLGCETERVEYLDDDGLRKVSVLGRKGEGAGGLAYFGHTDVVTTEDWSVDEHGAFEPVVRDGRLYGRGSTDMKGSIACMLAAVHSLAERPLKAPVYISCSSDEEVNHRGAAEIVSRSQLFRELVAGRACGIVGEATGMNTIFAHKGGCRVKVTSSGHAAHSSTREGTNANWAMIPFLAELKALRDESETDAAWMDDEFDPPTICLNVCISDNNRAVNITAPQSVCTFGFRPMPRTDANAILARLRSRAEAFGLDFVIEADHPAFRRDPTADFLQTCVELTGGARPRTVAYGSEASNFCEIENLVVLGPGDIAQAHKSDEWISLEQLELGERIYRRLIERFCL